MGAYIPETEIVGRKYGRLTIKKELPPRIWASSKKREFLCSCECGAETGALLVDMQRGRRTDCGCGTKERRSRAKKTHGMSKTRIYRIWTRMFDRCYNKSHVHFDRYGGRGIVICDEWNSFVCFLNDMKEGYSDDLSIDRINNDLGYYKENCRWATNTEQHRNTSSNVVIKINGIERCVAEWAEVSGVAHGTILWRLKHGRTGEDIIKLNNKS